MERSVRNNSALAHCSTACLPSKVQMAGVCLDVLLLRGGRCAANPWCARIFRRPRHAAHWSVSLHRCSAAVGLAVGFVFQPFPKNRDVARTDVRSVRGNSTARRYRVGFATALRGSFVSGHGMARSGVRRHVPESLPPSPGWSVAVLVLCSLVAHICYTEPLPPKGWAAIDTHYGGAGQGEPNFATEFSTHQSIQQTILNSEAVVLLFPEHLVSHWNEATEAFWESTITTAAAQHRTVLIGAGVSLPATSRNPFAQNRFQNVLLGRGQESDAFYQERIPIPIGMWKPFGTDGVPLNLLGRGTIRVRDQKAAVLICYEQLLVWPFLSSALEHPTILLTSSNDYWARDTRIPEIQRSSAESWARLFHLPMLSATNF